MSETPDFFRNQNGLEVPASRNPEPFTQNTVPRQKELNDFSICPYSGYPCAIECPYRFACEKAAAVDAQCLGRKDQGAGLIAPSGEQLVRVRELMRDGKERTLAEISEITGDPEASVSARLRDLRRPRYGLWTVKRKRVGSLFYYWLGGKGI